MRKDSSKNLKENRALNPNAERSKKKTYTKSWERTNITTANGGQRATWVTRLGLGLVSTESDRQQDLENDAAECEELHCDCGFKGVGGYL